MEVLHRDADSIAAQFRHIIALEEKDVPFGVFLRNDKSLVRMALLVEVSNEGTCVVAIYASAAEAYAPMSCTWWRVRRTSSACT